MHEDTPIVRIRRENKMLHAIFLGHKATVEEARNVILEKGWIPLSAGDLAQLKRYKFHFTLVAPEIDKGRVAALVQIEGKSSDFQYFVPECAWSERVAFGALEYSN